MSKVIATKPDSEEAWLEPLELVAVSHSAKQQSSATWQANPMHKAYRLEGPAIISFSGGRTSAFMLKRIIEAHGGELPGDVIPTFANTGKEHPATLHFVRECGLRWGVPIVWLEFDPAGAKMRRFKIVDHASASRNGEPYEAAIRERGYLPNPVSRYCTALTKIKPTRDYALSLGWDHWINVLGLRHDEARRVARAKNQRERWEVVAPLHEAGVTREDVAAFWAAQDFDLSLPSVNGKTPLGNCDACFLKSAATLSAIFRDDPSVAQWWVRMESIATPAKPSGARFRIDRPGYADMLAAAQQQRQVDFGEADELSDCFCTG